MQTSTRRQAATERAAETDREGWLRSLSARGLFLLIYPLLAGVLVLVLVLVRTWQVEGLYRDLDAAAVNRVEEQERLLENKLDYVVADVLTLARQNELSRYLAHGDRASLDRMAREYAARLRYSGLYQQIRLLDAQGRERVRVEQGGDGRTRSLVHDAVRSPSGDDDIAAALALEAEEIYISALGLDVTDGEVARPFVPILRLATPVVDAAGHHRGLVVIHYLAGRLLQRLEDVGRGDPSRPMLVNCDGYWLLAPVAEMRWGFMLEGRAQQRMQWRFPQVWQAMQRAEAGTVRTAAGFFAFQRVEPLRVDYPVRSSGCKGRAGGVSEAVSPLQWTMLAFVARTHYERAALTPTVVIGLFGLLLLGVLAAAVQSMISLYVNRRTQLYQLERLARTDALTGGANRIAFEERAALEIERAARHRRCFALCVIDLDGFKAINDAQGHLVGDEVLRFVAGVLSARLRSRSDDLAGRIGGDEFGLLLTELPGPEAVRAILEDVRRAIGAGEWDGQRVSASIGAALYPYDARHLPELFKCADATMYRAKSAGKDRVLLASDPEPVVG
ncbi:GGDEF domain-containing protein [Marichromatium bheemlicum]|uniref:diguanylate cyclase n=1 Tax=Marichromatium bheemlicum TaxID=365339 RepID=A0ABX1I9J6_9GAMM|nr:diguanylate cyclase [Marichromatium bheemlicum]NKN34220.1 GGDEF domain-containing protein [Marichromatium bheemlicum]